MGDNLMKRNYKEWLLTARKVFHFIATVLMYSICLIMVIVFLVFVINFIDKQYNLKSGQNKKNLFSAYTIVSPSMVPAINVLDVVVTVRVDGPEDLEKGDIITLTIPNIYTTYPDFAAEGYTVVDVRSFCEDNDLTLEIKYQDSDNQSDGTIIYQNMSPGTMVNEGATLKITVIKKGTTE